MANRRGPSLHLQLQLAGTVYNLEKREKTKENVGRGMLQKSGTSHPAAPASSQWHTQSGLAQSLFVGGWYLELNIYR